MIPTVQEATGRLGGLLRWNPELADMIVKARQDVSAARVLGQVHGVGEEGLREDQIAEITEALSAAQEKQHA